jgi:hypothetical protein
MSSRGRGGAIFRAALSAALVIYVAQRSDAQPSEY